MLRQLPRLTFAAAIAATAAFAAAGPGAGSAEAKDWLKALERNEKAAEAVKYQPKGKNPQWDFDLNTVVNDVNWRARTASMLRDLPRPGDPRRRAQPNQLADRPEPSRLQFRF
ncbi:MAG: hypothetical protein Tsb0032_26980 [Kiloniellaceae bacterium]